MRHWGRTGDGRKLDLSFPREGMVPVIYSKP
ncbi:hypothetical protein HNR76_000533 [Pseudoxanthomonas broegbernensis]|nr:hypothetical protein [Pseudoxanthomonas broegbernensis]